MKSKFRTGLVLLAAILFGQAVHSQSAGKSLKKSNAMNSVKQQSENKESIRFLYDSIFNKRQFEKLGEIISGDYTNSFGVKGVAAFQKSVLELSKAFPDAQWKVEEIIAEGNKVVVRQKFTGTHKNQFQNIAPTNKIVSVDGIAIYEIQNGKIIHSQVQTDRLGFLQQLGVLPASY